MDVHGETAEQYVELAAHAADSPCFEDWAHRVAEDPEVLAWLEALPVPKRQPNLVFAAARWHGVPAPGPYAGLRAALLEDDGSIRRTILERATQTNEVGRLATVVPALAAVAGDGPIALLEVGPSAGLCLYPDRYDYRWSTPDGVVEWRGAGPSRPVLTCEVTGPAPLPVAPPEVAWRGGIDLSPLDVGDADQMRWLEMLVWPEHDDRRRLLRTAIEVARTDPPALERGDLLDGLPDLVERASSYGTVVVFHSAVIAYLTPADRARFAAMVGGLVAEGRCHWVSNESPAVLPEVVGAGSALPEGRVGFVLGADGRAVGATQGHGRWLHWLG